MFEQITYMSNSECHIHFNNRGKPFNDLINMHVIFEDVDRTIVGEIVDFNGTSIKIKFLGEFLGNLFVSGTVRKPSLESRVRFIDIHELSLLFGNDEAGFVKLGMSPYYSRTPVYLPVNSFFSNHFAIMGNTGSGKSCGVSRLLQNVFQDTRLNPKKAHLFLFDSTGEYRQSLSNINKINSDYNYRFISTSKLESNEETFRIPIYLFNRDDLALLLQCDSHSQLPIIEKMLKLAKIFGINDSFANDYKNYLIAKAIRTILYTNDTSPNKRNEIFSLLDACNTSEFNMETPIQGIGYVRKFRDCFLIDNYGDFTEGILIAQYVASFIDEKFEDYEPKNDKAYFDLKTLEKALNFTLISEGWLRNTDTYADAITIKVRLHSLITGENAEYFDVDDYWSMEDYINSFIEDDKKKYQIVNINYSDVDDEFAKTLTKVLSRFLFEYSIKLENRGSFPFHIILEEAHRYIQHDSDIYMFGYNIFERIAKEGRKYGVLLGLISQRPGEISDTVISQCGNFIIFKLNHPADLQYLRGMVPHITDDIIEKQKELQPGMCLCFGEGFKIPLAVKLDLPDPSPLSENCDIFTLWGGTKSSVTTSNIVSQPVITNTIQTNAYGVAPVGSYTAPVNTYAPTQRVNPQPIRPNALSQKPVKDNPQMKSKPQMSRIIPESNSR